MYYPFLRGKQYELLALKELADVLQASGHICPLVEPVRAPEGSGLGRCLTALSEAEVGFVLVANPSVGGLVGPGVSPMITAFIESFGLEATMWNIGLLIDSSTDLDFLLTSYEASCGSTRPLTLIHLGQSPDLELLIAQTEKFNLRANVMNAGIRARHYRRLLDRGPGISLTDGFVPEDRNTDYLARPESIFSEEHLYYREEGWAGFSDYVTIGQRFQEGGFTPRAVVIHWTYEKERGGPVWIRHFTSTSNGDTSNVGGKFLEAARKLVDFLDERGIDTRAADVIRGHVMDETYPGLGIVKKLSIQNHLELMADILGRP